MDALNVGPEKLLNAIALIGSEVIPLVNEAGT
jgi:hypothetical protein